MFALLISIFTLVLSPLLYFAAIQYKKVWVVVERILALSIGAVVVLHLIPESVIMSGWSAIPLAFLGLFLPSVLERFWQRKAESIHFVALAIGVLGLGLHGIMDGAALALAALEKKSYFLPFT